MELEISSGGHMASADENYNPKKGIFPKASLQKTIYSFHPVKLILHAGSLALLQTLILWVGN